MATAAKLAMFPAAETLSAAEEYAQLTGEEIFEASRETSKVYNGQVLSRAVVIVQCRIRCRSIRDLARATGIARVTMYRYANGMPKTDGTLRKALRDLAALLAEDGKP
jgi:hypothetical protein